MRRQEYEWDGTFEDTEVTEWWCPTRQRWVWCDEPCPDGTPHAEQRTRTVRARHMRLVTTNDRARM